jgi:predicted esterase
MLSNAGAGRSRRRIVALLLELAACGGAIGYFGCSSEAPSAAPGASQSQNNLTCGNGVVDGSEQCDGAMLGGATCASATMGAFPSGTLACAANCGFDMSGCMTVAGGYAGSPPVQPTGGAGSPPGMIPLGTGGSISGSAGTSFGGGPPVGGAGAPPVGGAGAPPVGGAGAPPVGAAGMMGAAGAAPMGAMNPVIPPAPSDCPQWGNTTITYGGLAGIQLAAGAKPASPSAPMLIYWHGTGGSSGEFLTMAAPVANGVTAAGGVIVSFQGTTGGDLNSGTFIFGATDLKLIDNLVACAVRDHNVDPRKIFTMGCSAGGLMSTATAALRSSYIAAAAPNSGGFPVLTPMFETAHNAALMTVHGKKGADVVVIDFADASALADMTFKARGGFVIDCDTGGGHCGGSPLAGDVWKFFQAHPFGVSPEPWAGGLPAGFSSQCKIQ